MATSEREPATAFEFPCRFPIKAMGRADPGFRHLVIEIIRRHAPGLEESAVSVRASRGGSWLAVTAVVEATSRAQLDAIYQDLTADERIRWVL